MNGLGKRKASSKRKEKKSAGKLADSGLNDSKVLLTEVNPKKKIVQEEDPEIKAKQEEEKKSISNYKKKLTRYKKN